MTLQKTITANHLRSKGNFFENIAVQYLREKNFEILHCNFYVLHGEADIIAKDNSTLVFVEVKARTNNKFGAPEESITFKKQRALRKTADIFILQHPEIHFIECRFDVIAIDYYANTTEIRHFIDAF
jgi:putative endonuclease